MLQFDKVSMRYQPYPLAVIRPALAAGQYQELAANFPDTAIFGKLRKFDYKLSLSEKYNPDQYHRFLETNAPWKAFHGYVKSDGFIRSIVEFLKQNNVDLGVEDYWQPRGKRIAKALGGLVRSRMPSNLGSLRTRFEFSVLRADGGEVAAHTDMPSKIITLVLSMVRDGEWPDGYGGGLDINEPTDDAYAFNWKNRIVPWDKIKVLDTVPFVPNQCTVFVKTFNSLHSVRRMTQTGSDALRKTVTIVIEKD
jgi:hypothetical protein